MKPTVTKTAIAVVAVAALVALVYIATAAFGIAIPGWVIQVFWVLFVAFVIIGAIKLIASMWSE